MKRRDFIKVLVGGLACVAVPGLSVAADKKIKRLALYYDHTNRWFKIAVPASTDIHNEYANVPRELFINAGIAYDVDRDETVYHNIPGLQFDLSDMTKKVIRRMPVTSVKTVAKIQGLDI